MNICRDCKFCHVPKMPEIAALFGSPPLAYFDQRCKHPDAADMVTGYSTKCRTERNTGVCGRNGFHWEPIPS